jgi:hypothetical protein
MPLMDDLEKTMDKKSIYSAPLYKHSELTEQIIGAFYAVYSALGYGFLENVYAKAIMIELKQRGLKVHHEFPIKIYYAVKSLVNEHEAQLLNYLKATPYEVGLLLNFGPKPETKRRSFDNNRKEWWLARNKP